MKIVFFNYLPLEYGGGLARAYIDTAVGLLKRNKNLEISIVTLNTQLAAHIGRIYSLYFGANPLSKKIKQSDSAVLKKTLGNVTYHQAGSLKELRLVFRQHDVIYSKNDIMEAFLLKFFVGYFHLPPVIIGFHTPVYYEMPDSLQMKIHNLMYSPLFYDYLLSGATAFHVLNDFDYKLLARRFPRKPIYKIHNPFDTKKFTYEKKEKNNKQAKLLWVGRLTREKGADELIKIIEETHNKINIRWTIIGIGELLPEIAALQEKFDTVTYVPSVAYNDMPPVYRNHDIFVMTSKCECFPYVLLEAQASGLPVIAYNIHGVNDIVDKKTGVLVPKNIEFAPYLIEMIEKNNFSQKSIAENIGKKFDYEQNYKNLYKMFMSI